MELKNQIRLTIALGVLSLFAVLTGHLALTDISHAEVDVSLEWNVLRACAVALVVFTIYTMVTLRQILKRL